MINSSGSAGGERSMNKFILGSILAAISLMAIYGTSASNRVTSWVDGSDRTAAQSDFGQSNDGDNSQIVALNETGQVAQIGSRTPLEKAGEIPQRQTIGAQSAPAFGTEAQPANDDTDGEIVEADPPVQNTPAPGANQGQNQQPVQQPPIRALW